jgi:hypothetical protein
VKVKNMSLITPSNFWINYKEQLTTRLLTQPKEVCDKIWTNCGDKIWTKEFAIPAAEEVCKTQLKLLTERELLRIDVAGYQQRNEGKCYNWDLRVAFEHENRPYYWRDELCKLCHVMADLRILVAYYSPTERSDFRHDLQEQIKLMEERIDRKIISRMDNGIDQVIQSQWLFIWGPVDSSNDDNPWVACELENRQLKTISNGKTFCPYTIFKQRSDTFNNQQVMS